MLWNAYYKNKRVRVKRWCHFDFTIKYNNQLLAVNVKISNLALTIKYHLYCFLSFLNIAHFQFIFNQSVKQETLYFQMYIV